MSEMISIQETHKLPYIKGVFTAMKLGGGSTAPVRFYDSDDNDLGYTIYTNSQGFVCDANGNLLGNGVFVHVDAVISGHYNGSTFTQWVVRGLASDVKVYDGKMRNANGDVVWSANSQNDYTLKWSDIAGKPDINTWSENEQLVVLETNTAFDNVIVNKYTKIMVIGYLETLGATETGNVTLFPQPTEPQRYGQCIFVQIVNSKSRVTQLWNADDTTPFCTIRGNGSALIALLSNGKFVCLQQTGETDLNDVGTVELSGSDLAYPRPISDTTPTILQIKKPTQWVAVNNTGYGNLFLAKGSLVKPKRMLLWWMPEPEDAICSCRVYYWNGNGTVHLTDLMPYSPVEVMVYPITGGNGAGVSVVTLGDSMNHNVLPTQVVAESGGSGGTAFQSQTVHLPTACTRLEIVWDMSSVNVQEGATGIQLTTWIEVPADWRGDILIQTRGLVEASKGLPWTHYVCFFCGWQGAERVLLTSSPGNAMNMVNQRIELSEDGPGFAYCHIETEAVGGYVTSIQDKRND